MVEPGVQIDGWRLGKLDRDRAPWWAVHGLAEARFSVVACRVFAGGQEWRRSLITAPWLWPCAALFRVLCTPVLGPAVGGLFALPISGPHLVVWVELCSAERSTDAPCVLPRPR